MKQLKRFPILLLFILTAFIAQAATGIITKINTDNISGSLIEDGSSKVYPFLDLKFPTLGIKVGDKVEYILDCSSGCTAIDLKKIGGTTIITGNHTGNLTVKPNETLILEKNADVDGDITVEGGGTFFAHLGTRWGNLAMLSGVVQSKATLTGSLPRGKITNNGGSLFLTNSIVSKGIEQNGGSLFVVNSLVADQLVLGGKPQFSSTGGLVVNGSINAVGEVDMKIEGGQVNGNVTIKNAKNLELRNTNITGDVTLDNIQNVLMEGKAGSPMNIGGQVLANKLPKSKWTHVAFTHKRADYHLCNETELWGMSAAKGINFVNSEIKISDSQIGDGIWMEGNTTLNSICCLVVNGSIWAEGPCDMRIVGGSVSGNVTIEDAKNAEFIRTDIDGDVNLDNAQNASFEGKSGNLMTIGGKFTAKKGAKVSLLFVRVDEPGFLLDIPAGKLTGTVLGEASTFESVNDLTIINSGAEDDFKLKDIGTLKMKTMNINGKFTAEGNGTGSADLDDVIIADKSRIDGFKEVKVTDVEFKKKADFDDNTKILTVHVCHFREDVGVNGIGEVNVTNSVFDGKANFDLAGRDFDNRLLVVHICHFRVDVGVGGTDDVNVTKSVFDGKVNIEGEGNGTADLNDVIIADKSRIEGFKVIKVTEVEFSKKAEFKYSDPDCILTFNVCHFRVDVGVDGIDNVNVTKSTFDGKVNFEGGETVNIYNSTFAKDKKYKSKSGVLSINIYDSGNSGKVKVDGGNTFNATNSTFAKEVDLKKVENFGSSGSKFDDKVKVEQVTNVSVKSTTGEKLEIGFMDKGSLDMSNSTFSSHKLKKDKHFKGLITQYPATYSFNTLGGDLNVDNTTNVTANGNDFLGKLGFSGNGSVRVMTNIVLGRVRVENGANVTISGNTMGHQDIKFSHNSGNTSIKDNSFSGGLNIDNSGDVTVTGNDFAGKVQLNGNANANVVNNKMEADLKVKDNGIVNVTNNTINGNLKIEKTSISCYEANNIVSGTNSGCDKTVNKKGKDDEPVVANTPVEITEAILGNVFPNPVTGTSTLEITLSNNDPRGIVQVVSLTGVVIASYEVEAGHNELQFDATQITQGMYFVNLKTQGGKVLTTKFIVRR